MKLWGGRFEKEMDKQVHLYTSSIELDARLWQVDIEGSLAHVEMLTKQKIISDSDGALIIEGLKSIAKDFLENPPKFNIEQSEDIHSEIEKRLVLKIGPVAGKLHTGRSRNDQTATDLRLYLRQECHLLIEIINELQKTIHSISRDHFNTILPGMTHLQHAQPISLAHHLLSYFWMFERDKERISDCIKRLNELPLGSAALAGTGFPIDRNHTARKLKFDRPTPNSLDAVSDRDYVIEFLGTAAIIQMHLSRLSEELILWSTPEFRFIEMSDEVTTGSSIMPQKKNPDVAELIRGKTGRNFGALVGVLTMMKGLPLSYNRDMQEDKFHLFVGLDNTKSSLILMNVVLNKTQWLKENMESALIGDFSNATDLADDLVSKGLTFREAHEVTGRIVQYCIKNNKILENLEVDELKNHHKLCDELTKKALLHQNVLNARNSYGGTSPDQVQSQWLLAKTKLKV